MSHSAPGDARPFALVTGASSGIGQELAIRLSQDHRLILNGRNGERLQETLAACHAPQEHLVWSYDLAQVETLAESLTGFLSGHGAQVQAFVHCAAVLKILPLKSINLQIATDTFNTNFFAALEIMNCLCRRKVNSKTLRSAVFISSIASKFGARGFSVYCASKGALDALMKALAVELAPAVRVNSVLPGGVRTKMTQNIFDDPEMVAKFERDYPLGIGEPSDIYHAVNFLLSEKARWITGQQFVVDGGRTANITA